MTMTKFVLRVLCSGLGVAFHTQIPAINVSEISSAGCMRLHLLWLGTPITDPNFDPNFNWIVLNQKNV
jgi:hypothetical protein